MKLFIKAVPNSKQQKVEKISSNIYKVWLRSLPVEGKANQELVKILSEYFKVPKLGVRIIGGGSFREKIVEIVG